MKNLFKIVFVFALMAANLSWGGDFIGKLTIRLGDKETALNAIAEAYEIIDGEKYPYQFVSSVDYYTDRAHAQDLLERTGKDYSYMGYAITPYVKNVNGSNYELPITDIIVKDYSKGDNIPNVLYENGRRYEKVEVRGYKTEGKNVTDTLASDLCNARCGNHRIQIYFTRDYIDGKFVRYLRVLPKGSTLDWYECIEIDLTGGEGHNKLYLHYKKEAPYTNNYWFDPVPTGRNPSSNANVNYMYFTGTPRALLTDPGTPKGYYTRPSDSDVEYKINDGPWTTSYKATDAGEYRIQAKIVSKNPRYLDYIYEKTLTSEIHKAPKLEVYNQLEDGEQKDYKLYEYTLKNQRGETSNFYSGDKITLTWSDKCGGTATRKFNNDLRSGKVLDAGLYSLTVGFDETPNCEAISSSDPTSRFATFTVEKSKIIFDADGGTFSNGKETYVVEGETGESYTKPANPTRTGYTFKGWSSSPSKIERGERTITANWKVKTYTMTFDADGGKFDDGTSSKVITQEYGTPISVPEKPTRTDYVFTGWDRLIPSRMPAQNVTITARWMYIRYRVDLPDQMEVVQGEAAEDGTFADKSDVKFRLKPGYVLWGEVTCDGETLTADKNGVYTVSVAGRDLVVKAGTIAKVFGGIQIGLDGSKAIIDGNTNEVSEVPEEYEVTKIEYQRTFEYYKATTIVLPFSARVGYVWGGIFCKFLGMAKSGFQYTARLMFVSTDIQANEPYVFVPLDEHITIDYHGAIGQKFTIKTEEKSVTFGEWSFNSLYHEKVWNGGVSEGDANGQVSYYFKPTEQEVDGVSGSFVKMTEGSVAPMQAYISYNGNKPQGVKRSPALAGKSAPTFSIADLPDEINIELVDESEKTVGLGKMNMSTGKVKLDCWFDMKGNLLKGKPTAKGVYFYNGKQVIVK